MLRSVGLLDILHEYDCGGLGRKALAGRRLRRLATTSHEKSGLGEDAVDDLAVNIGEPEIATGVSVGQLLVIEAQ